MKYFLIFLLALILFSCRASQPGYTIRATVVKIKPEGSGYWIFFRSSYRWYKTYQASLPDSIFVGKVLELPVVYRVK